MIFTENTSGNPAIDITANGSDSDDQSPLQELENEFSTMEMSDFTTEQVLAIQDQVTRVVEGRLPKGHFHLGMNRDDLIQELVTKIIKEPGKFKPQQNGSLAGWIYTVCANYIKDHLKRIARSWVYGFMERVPILLLI